VRIGQRREAGGERTFVVLRDDLVDEPTYGGAILDRVETAAADELPDLRLDRVDRTHVRTVSRRHSPVPRPVDGAPRLPSADDELRPDLSIIR
jgi:hypothetical protein